MAGKKRGRDNDTAVGTAAAAAAYQLPPAAAQPQAQAHVQPQPHEEQERRRAQQLAALQARGVIRGGGTRRAPNPRNGRCPSGFRRQSAYYTSTGRWVPATCRRKPVADVFEEMAAAGIPVPAALRRTRGRKPRWDDADTAAAAKDDSNLYALLARVTRAARQRAPASPTRRWRTGASRRMLRNYLAYGRSGRRRTRDRDDDAGNAANAAAANDNNDDANNDDANNNDNADANNFDNLDANDRAGAIPRRRTARRRGSRSDRDMGLQLQRSIRALGPRAVYRSLRELYAREVSRGDAVAAADIRRDMRWMKARFEVA